MRRLKLGGEGGHDDGDGTIVRNISSSFAGPDGIGADTAIVGPFFAFLLKIGTTDELNTEGIAIRFRMLYGANKVGGLTAEVGLVSTTEMG